MLQPFQCANCDHVAEYVDLPPAQDLAKRMAEMSPGDVFSDVECPDCGALCFPQTETDEEQIEAIKQILIDEGESLLDDDAVDQKVAGEIAQKILHRLNNPTEETHANT